MSNGDHEHAHSKTIRAGEIGLGAAVILGGIAVTGLHIRKVHTAKERHMSHLGQLPRDEKPRDLPPVAERLSLFDFDQTGEPNGQTRVAGLIHYLTTKEKAEKAIPFTELQQSIDLPEAYLILALRNLNKDGFVDIEEADDDVYLTSSGDLAIAETMSEPLQVAVSDWAQQAASGSL